MNRDIRNDYNNFSVFLRDFKIDKQLLNDHYEKSLKFIHKKVYALMIVVNEIKFQNNSEITKKGMDYFQELLSDLIQMTFCWACGAYKPSLLLLRSSIETYIKIIVGITDNSIFTEKSVYQIFDTAKVSKGFTINEHAEKSLIILRSNYIVLCQYVHNATETNFEAVNSIGLLPKYESDLADIVVKLITSTINIYLSHFIICFKNTYKNMYFRNKNTLLECIPKDIKSKIFIINN